MTLLSVGHKDTCSETMAHSIGVNPVVVRTLMSRLRRAGLIKTRQGVAGGTLGRPAEQITLRDIYNAIEEKHDIFGVHANPDKTCPVGQCISPALGELFVEAQNAMEEKLAQTTLAQFIEDLTVRVRSRHA